MAQPSVRRAEKRKREGDRCRKRRFAAPDEAAGPITGKSGKRRTRSGFILDAALTGRMNPASRKTETGKCGKFVISLIPCILWISQ